MSYLKSSKISYSQMETACAKSRADRSAYMRSFVFWLLARLRLRAAEVTEKASRDKRGAAEGASVPGE